MDVDEAGDEIGVRRGRGREQRHRHGTKHRVGLLHRCAGVRQHIRPGLDAALVEGARRQRRREHGRSAEGGDGVSRVVVESVRVAGSRRGAVEATVGLQVPLLGAGARHRIAVEAAPAVLTHHEQPHGRRLGDRVGVALEGGVVPAQMLAVETTAAVEGRPGGAGAEVELSGVAEVGAVRPGADEQMGRAAAMALGYVAHRLVLAQRAGGEDVVPAADVEGVGVDALVGVVGPWPAIERGVERAADGGDDGGHQAAGEVGELPERQQVEQLARREPGGRRAELGHGAGELLGFCAMSTQEEVGTDLELQPTQARSLVRPARSFLRLGHVVEARHPGNHAFQCGRLHHGGTPLRLGVVRASEHADLTVRAGEPGGPLNRVVAVLELLVARGELAVRGVAATDVLHHDDVAARSEEHRVGVHQVDVDVLVVRLSGQQHRVTTVVCGPVDVGPQHDPVAHPCLDVVLDQNVVSPRDRSGHGASPAGGNEGDGTIDGQSSRILCTIASSAIE